MNNPLAFLLFCAAAGVFCLPACSTRRAAPPADPDEIRAASRLYDEYTAETARQSRRPSRVTAALRFGGNDDGRRIVVLLWKNADGPIRLDARAGIGADVAKIRQDDARFLAYSTQEKRAYHHDGPGQALLAYGLPMPFGLRDLSALLDGDFGAVFGPVPPDGARGTRKNGLLFALPEPDPGGVLELDRQGMPVAWEEDGGGWILRFSYDGSESPPLPKRIEARHPNGKYAVLLVKERERPERPFSAEQLELRLPPETPLLPLRETRNP
jgi:outer membrane biogenesis lipoprotein LolB